MIPKDIESHSRTLQVILAGNALMLARLQALEIAFVTLAEESGYSSEEMMKSLRKTADKQYERLLFQLSDQNPDAAEALDLLDMLKKKLDKDPASDSEP